MGFSAGGHLASTVGTHFGAALVPDAEGPERAARFHDPCLPVISMTKELTHSGSRDALIGQNPSDEQVRRFSNELQVGAGTPPPCCLPRKTTLWSTSTTASDFSRRCGTAACRRNWCYSRRVSTGFFSWLRMNGGRPCGRGWPGMAG